MGVRPARHLPAAVAVATAVTGTLTWAPTATAQSSQLTPSASAAPTGTLESDAGSVAIVKNDPAGDVLQGAAFLLLDATGQEAGNGKTDALGKLTFTDLVPGVYRLKETDSGSPLHDVVADQDVIVTPGGTAPLTIVDPFKPAQVLLRAKDDKTGKLLPGATVNIGTGDKTLLTLTTGDQGTATAKLPVDSRTGTDLWVKETKAPTGYELDKGQRDAKAKPGDPVTVTVTNAKTHTAPPAPDPSDKPTEKPSEPTDKPIDKPKPKTPGDDSTSTPAEEPSGTPSADETRLQHDGAQP
ncbi:SpaA isopeptide-forming pilin-related protein [Streptomyces sp. NPDC058989]|uniref:MSCRAMM family protein n=1 Tax=Streptomyces sp. NPDC058989 TaxID=3346686 RepID=UPI0036C70B23